MSQPIIYPKEPFIGVDFSGQPNTPQSMIGVATRYTRRKKEARWIVRIRAEEIGRYRAKQDWQEKVYAAIAFKVIDKVLQPKYAIHIDKEYQDPNQQNKLIGYIEYLIGSFHSGDPEREKPDIETNTKYESVYVMDAHRKHKMAREGTLPIDEKTGIDYLMKLLEHKKF